MKKLLFTLFIFPFLLTAQHSIKGAFAPAEDFSWAILYQVTPTNTIYTAQASIKDVFFEFPLDSTVVKGVYRLVYAIPQEEYNFDIIYNGEEDVDLTFSLEEGVTFINSKENSLLANYSKTMIGIGEQISTTYNQSKPSKKELTSLFKKLDTTQIYFEKQAKNTLALHFIRANKPYIPSKYEEASSYVKNLQNNYFTEVDFTNETLQSSHFLMDRSMAYIFGVFSPSEDKAMAYKINIDTIVKQLQKSNVNFKTSFLEKLWQKLIDVEHVDLANYLASKHLIPFAKEVKNTKLVNKLFLFKSISIGSVAPNFSWATTEGEETKTQWLSQLDVANNYILVFWSSNCSHCLKEIPQLQELLKSFPENQYQVIAIGLEDEEFGWEIETRSYPEFINILGLGKWDNSIGNAYDVSATPTYFVLDKDKVIVAKPEDFEELEKFLKK